jgi:translocation and assembly module TamB
VKWLKIFLVLLLVGVLLVAAGLGFLLATETGLRVAFGWASGAAPGELSAERLRGRLLGPIELEGVRYRDEQTDLALARARLEWQPRRLLAGSLHVDRLEAQGLHVHTRPPEDPPPDPPPDTEFPDVELPIRIVLGQAELRDLRLTREADGAPLVIHRLALAAEGEGDRLRIERLQMESDPAQVHALQGVLQTRSPYALDLEASWTAQLPDGEQISASGHAQGDLRTLRVRQVFVTPLNASVGAVLHDVLEPERMRWEVNLRAPAVNPRRFDPEWPALSVDVRAEAAGDRHRFQAGGAALMVDPEFGPVEAAFAVAWVPERLAIQRLSVQIPQAEAQVGVQGEWLGDTGTLHLQGTWQGLAWPLIGEEHLVQSPRGRFAVSGSAEAYELSAEAHVLGPDVPEGDWIVRGAGTSERFEATEIRAEILTGTLEGQGSVRWAPEIAWNLQVEGRALDPAAAWADWPGQIALQARSEGRVENGAVHGSAEIERLDGTLREYPLEARARFEIAGEDFQVSALELRSGQARLQASGSLADRWDLGWNLQAPQLEALLPDAAGALTASGRLSGPRDAPQIRLSAEGRGLAFAEHSVAALDAEVDVDLQEQRASGVDLQLRELAVAGQTLDTLRLQGEGLASEHTLSLTASGADVALDLRLQGGVVARRWEGAVRAASIAVSQLGEWHLHAPADLRFGPEEAYLEWSCWGREAAELCQELEWQPDDGVRARATLAEIPIAMVQPLLHPDLQIEGTLAGQGTLHYTAEALLLLDVELTPTDGQVTYVTFLGDEVVVGYRDARFRVQGDQDGLRAELGLRLDPGGLLEGSLALPDFNMDIPAQRQRLSGQLQLRLEELGILPAFIAELDATEGLLEADLQFAGTLEEPTVLGELTLREAAADVPRLGIRVQDLRLQARSDGSDILALSGSARSGDGTVQFSGELVLDPERGWPLDASLQGERFLAMNTPETRMLVSPRLQLRVRGSRVDVEGELVIPEADLSPIEGVDVVPVSPDVLIIDDTDDPEVDVRTWDIFARVRLRLGDRVEFAGFGVTGRITGDVLAIDQPDRLTSGTGELQFVDGVYEAYGQMLEIERGRMIFAGGPVENPGLDVRAVRRVGEVIAGIQVRGFLRAPEITLFSEPPMPQSDVLSYLLIGRPMRQATTGEGRMMSEAAMKLGIAGGELLAQRIGAAFGLEDVYVEAGPDADEVALVVGTYLSPRLYVSYGIGVFEPASTLRIRYELGRRWTIQTETGPERRGADVLFTIER